MGKNRRFGVVQLVSVAAGLSIGVACSNVSAPAPPKQGEDIVVGIPLAATGDVSQEGKLARQGYDLWLDWANKDGGILVQGERHKVRALYEDDASNPATGAQLVTKMVNEEGA